jgi:hypothetical protein
MASLENPEAMAYKVQVGNQVRGEVTLLVPLDLLVSLDVLACQVCLV